MTEKFGFLGVFFTASLTSFRRWSETAKGKGLQISEALEGTSCGSAEHKRQSIHNLRSDQKSATRPSEEVLYSKTDQTGLPMNRNQRHNISSSTRNHNPSQEKPATPKIPFPDSSRLLLKNRESRNAVPEKYLDTWKMRSYIGPNFQDVA